MFHAILKKGLNYANKKLKNELHVHYVGKNLSYERIWDKYCLKYDFINISSGRKEYIAKKTKKIQYPGD